MISKQLFNARLSKYASLPASRGRVEKSAMLIDLHARIPM